MFNDIYATLKSLEILNALDRKEETVQQHIEQDTLQQLLAIETMSGKTPGILKIHRGECPTGGKNSMACMLCHFGHMLECHYPQTCEEAECSHWLGENLNLDDFEEGPDESDMQPEVDLSGPEMPLQGEEVH